MSGTKLAEDDATLVALCLEDREDAWAELVRRHGPLVWAVTRRSGLAGEDAADVYQSVWLAALEGLPNLRDPARLPAWLARTAQLKSLQALRDLGIERRALSRVPAQEPVEPRSPDADLAALEDRVRVAEALARTGERCRQLLRQLYYLSPAPSYAEIAQRLGMPVGSVGPTRARCLERVAEALGGDAS